MRDEGDDRTERKKATSSASSFLKSGRRGAATPPLRVTVVENARLDRVRVASGTAGRARWERG